VNTPGIVARLLRGYDIAGRAHSRRSRLIPASLTAAAAKVRAAMSAAVGKRCGWITVSLVGHLTMT
jgi:hypothetical protein